MPKPNLSWTGDPRIRPLVNQLNGLLNALGAFPLNEKAEDGELLIGKSDGTFALNTLTAGANIVITNGEGTIEIASTGGGSGYTTVEDEGTPVTQRTTLNFVGAGVSVADSGGKTQVTIGAGGSYTDEEAQDAVGTILTDSSSIDFTYNDAGPSITASVLPAGVDHGGLAGLADDDHTQYLLLAGRAGGQTATGGTGSGDDLILESTSDGTKGDVFLGSGTNRVGLLANGDLFFDGNNHSITQGNASGLGVVSSFLSNSILRVGEAFGGLGLYTGDGGTAYDAVIAAPAGKKVGISANGGNPFIGDSGILINASNQVGINQDTPAYSLDLGNNTDATFLQRGTTAQRPTGTNGLIRQNSDINSPEFYTEAWTQFVGVLDRQVTQLDINTNNTLQTFYTFSVPANVLDTQKMLRLRLFGDYLNNSGGTSTLLVRVAFGGTTMYDETSTALTANASRKPFDFEFLLANQNSASVQVLGGTIGLGISGGATTGLGGMNTVITNATGFSTPVFGTAAVNTGSAQTLTVSIQHSVSNAAVSIRRQFAILEVL